MLKVFNTCTPVNKVSGITSSYRLQLVLCVCVTVIDEEDSKNTIDLSEDTSQLSISTPPTLKVPYTLFLSISVSTSQLNNVDRPS